MARTVLAMDSNFPHREAVIETVEANIRDVAARQGMALERVDIMSPAALIDEANRLDVPLSRLMRGL